MARHVVLYPESAQHGAEANVRHDHARELAGVIEERSRHANGRTVQRQTGRRKVERGAGRVDVAELQAVAGNEKVVLERLIFEIRCGGANWLRAVPDDFDALHARSVEETKLLVAPLEHDGCEKALHDVEQLVARAAGERVDASGVGGADEGRRSRGASMRSHDVGQLLERSVDESRLGVRVRSEQAQCRRSRVGFRRSLYQENAHEAEGDKQHTRQQNARREQSHGPSLTPRLAGVA